MSVDRVVAKANLDRIAAEAGNLCPACYAVVEATTDADIVRCSRWPTCPWITGMTAGDPAIRAADEHRRAVLRNRSAGARRGAFVRSRMLGAR